MGIASKYYDRSEKHWTGWFYDEVYRADIYIVWPVDEDKLAKFVQKQFSVEIERRGEFGGRCLQIEGIDDVGEEATGYVVGMPDFSMTPCCISRLAHECLHLTSFVLEERGLYLNSETEEAWAYYHEFLMRKALEIMNKNSQ